MSTQNSLSSGIYDIPPIVDMGLPKPSFLTKGQRNLITRIEKLEDTVLDYDQQIERNRYSPYFSRSNLNKILTKKTKAEKQLRKQESRYRAKYGDAISLQGTIGEYAGVGDIPPEGTPYETEGMAMGLYQRPDAPVPASQFPYPQQSATPNIMSLEESDAGSPAIGVSGIDSGSPQDFPQAQMQPQDYIAQPDAPFQNLSNIVQSGRGTSFQSLSDRIRSNPLNNQAGENRDINRLIQYRDGAQAMLDKGNVVPKGYERKLKKDIKRQNQVIAKKISAYKRRFGEEYVPDQYKATNQAKEVTTKGRDDEIQRLQMELQTQGQKSDEYKLKEGEDFFGSKLFRESGGNLNSDHAKQIVKDALGIDDEAEYKKFAETLVKKEALKDQLAGIKQGTKLPEPTIHKLSEVGITNPDKYMSFGFPKGTEDPYKDKRATQDTPQEEEAKPEKYDAKTAIDQPTDKSVVPDDKKDTPEGEIVKAQEKAILGDGLAPEGSIDRLFQDVAMDSARRGFGLYLSEGHRMMDAEKRKHEKEIQEAKQIGEILKARAKAMAEASESGKLSLKDKYTLENSTRSQILQNKIIQNVVKSYNAWDGFKGYYAQATGKKGASGKVRKYTINFGDGKRLVVDPNDPETKLAEGIADIGLVYSIISLLDPQSVVKEGEIDLVGSAIAGIDKIARLIDRVKSSGQLRPEQRKALLILAQQTMLARSNSFLAEVNGYRETVDERGFSPSASLGSGVVYIAEDLTRMLNDNNLLNERMTIDNAVNGVLPKGGIPKAYTIRYGTTRAGTEWSKVEL